MEFINVEEFLKQDKKIQGVLLEWWKPTVGDLYCSSNSKVLKVVDVDILYEYEITGSLSYTTYYFNSIADKIIPLLTEGQLIKFIEDNGYTFKIEKYDDGEYTLEIFQNTIIKFIVNDMNLLEVYWKAAIRIIKNKNKRKRVD